jgi:hypothetical protein
MGYRYIAGDEVEAMLRSNKGTENEAWTKEDIMRVIARFSTHTQKQAQSQRGGGGSGSGGVHLAPLMDKAGFTAMYVELLDDASF